MREMKVMEIICDENETIFVYYNIFIINKIRFFDGIIYSLANKLKDGKDISIDLNSLLRDIESFETRIYDRLERGEANDESVKENTATFCRAIADNFKKKHEILAQMVNSGRREIPQILLTTTKIKNY